MYFLGVECDIRRAPNLPLIEVSAKLINSDSKYKTFFSFKIGMKLVELVQKHGVNLIPPFGTVPKDKDIFFIAQFENNEKTESFLREWKN